IRQFKGQRIFERIMLTVTSKWARTLEGVLGTRRLQPQLMLLFFIATLAAGVSLLGGIGQVNFSMDGFDPAFTMMWAIGIVCAVMAAQQAKFHRLVSLVLMGGAGLVVCMTFVWFSAPDLAVTQLL